jgi:hypothetical protein
VHIAWLRFKFAVPTPIPESKKSISVMALRAATRLSATVLRTSRCRKCIPNTVYVLYAGSMQREKAHRWYATSVPPNKKFDIPEEYTEEVFNALANNPPVMQAMHKLIEALNQRGIKLDREPSVTELWKIMKDKEIMNALTECTANMKEANTSINGNKGCRYTIGSVRSLLMWLTKAF